jgi:ADP-ribose pyrophosphatase YjhB (NUDIX family)
VEIGRFGVGASCVLLDGRGHVLLVHQTYGRSLWALPGGNAEPGEAPEAAARRELLEETDLQAGGVSLVGVYFEPNHDRGPFLHFAFLVRWNGGESPRPDGIEVAEARLWPASSLPRPHTELTSRRIDDAVAGRTGVVATVTSRIIT